MFGILLFLICLVQSLKKVRASLVVSICTWSILEGRGRERNVFIGWLYSSTDFWTLLSSLLILYIYGCYLCCDSYFIHWHAGPQKNKDNNKLLLTQCVDPSVIILNETKCQTLPNQFSSSLMWSTQPVILPIWISHAWTVFDGGDYY